jgi:putative transposase
VDVSVVIKWEPLGGRALDNIFVERLWRSLKYEDIYLKSYATVPQLIQGLVEYFRFYNTERMHQSLGNSTQIDCLPDGLRRRSYDRGQI